jgi:hypothetical protein
LEAYQIATGGRKGTSTGGRKAKMQLKRLEGCQKKLTQPNKVKAQSIGLAHIVASEPAVNSIFGQLEEIFSNFLG